ncbi:MAG: HAMP domain-containing protein [Deltaproteobacteria bacterium]|nr:HAMP domain-containing protein [Deltaproteobacteria bacterium]MDQ3299708.1 HAMP domain-containing histidine kinase [Myxococcota bacterium]
MRIGLRTRITALCLMVVLAAIALCEVYLSDRLERVLLERMRADLIVRLELVEREASSVTESMQQYAVWDQIADDFALRSMTWVTLARTDGTVLGDSKLSDNQLGTKFDLPSAIEVEDALAHGFGESRRYSHLLEENALFVAVPFRMEDVVVGVARVGIPTTQFKAAVEPIRRVLLVAWGLALLAALVLAWPAAHLITGRLARITAAARRMAKGQLQTRTEVAGGDEVGELARVLDSLAEALGDTLGNLTKLEASRRELVANASHELRTPLTAICGASETLVAGAIDDPKAAREFVVLIDDNARRLRRLVDDLLDLSQLDAGRFPLRWEHVETNPLVESVMRTYRARAELRGIKLKCEIEAEARTVYADSRAFEHVLGNLVDNAVKYCAPGTDVEVHAVRVDDGIVFSVQDSGPGIEAHHLASVFERFYRAETSRSRETGGTGLGLAIAKQLIEAMGGQIGVTSEKDHGSRFWFSLPRTTS